MLPLNVNLPLKTVTNRIRSCLAVLWALDTFGDRLVALLEESFGALLGEGQEMPFATQLELFRKKLILGRDRMTETDRAYRDQRARESLFRAKRDGRVKEVNADVVGLRRAFTGIYGDDKIAEFGFARRVPQQPGELLEQTSHLVARLVDPDLDLSGARFSEFRFEVPELASQLAGSVDALRLSVDDLAREERRTEAMKLAKDDALAEYNRWFLWIARTVESLCRLAGLDEVAKRVRPSSRRPGETEQTFEQPESGEPEGEASDQAPPPSTDSTADSSD